MSPVLHAPQRSVERTPKKYEFRGTAANGDFQALVSALSGRQVERLSIPTDFRASAVRAQLGEIELFHLTTGPHDSQLGKPTERSRIPIVIMLGGSENEADDLADSWVLDDFATRGRSVRCKRTSDIVTLLLPRSAVSPALLPLRPDRDRQPDGTPGRALAGPSLLLRGFILDVLRNLSSFGETGRAVLGETLISLVNALAIETQTHESTRNIDLLRARVRTYISNRLWDPELSIDKIVGHMRCSKRYLHEIFHETGSTVMGMILAMRLERTATDLRNSCLVTESVASIAFKWGFVCQSHFSRTFRKHFGVSPTQYRNRYCGEKSGLAESSWLEQLPQS